MNIEEFIQNELNSLIGNVVTNYKNNMKIREDNPFLPLDASTQKYMALGRSIDSQLGNRIQRIAFYFLRQKLGKIAVPNITAIDISKTSIILTLYSIDLEIADEYQNKNFNPFSQYIYINKSHTDSEIKNKLKVQSKFSGLTTLNYTFKNKLDSTLMKEYEQFYGKDYPVDLIAFSISENKNKIAAHVDGVSIYEIKMGGNLDTKNAKSNANEVKKNEFVFKFLKKRKSYFSTCYGKCSASIKKEIINLKNDNCLLQEPTDFWENVLPNSLTYNDFIAIYKAAFIKAKIKQNLKAL